MRPPDAAVRLFVYESARSDRIPSPREIARGLSITPREAVESLRRLQEEHDALVLLPGSAYIWMAEPFSAVPTDYPVEAETGRWFGNCIWDALAVASLVGGRCRIPATCPESGTPLELSTEGETLTQTAGTVRFAVPPANWWESIGFT